MCVALAGLAAGGLGSIGSIASFAVGAFGAIANYSAQQAQFKAQQDQYNQNVKNAREAANNRYTSLTNTLLSEKKKAESEVAEVQREGLKARATAITAAGEAGVGGLSVKHLINDFFFQEAAYTDRIGTNYDTTVQATRDEYHSTYDTARARINSVARPVKPSFAGAAVRILGGAIQTFGGQSSYAS